MLDLLNDSIRIYNCDESGCSGRLNASTKVFVPKYVHHAYQTGHYIWTYNYIVSNISCWSDNPAHAFFLNKYSHCQGPTIQLEYLITGYLNKQKTDSGFINNDLYLEWFNDDFLQSIGKTRPLFIFCYLQLCQSFVYICNKCHQS